LISWRAVKVECLALKPCCDSIFGKLSVKCGRMVLSSVLAMGDRSEIGR